MRAIALLSVVILGFNTSARADDVVFVPQPPIGRIVEVDVPKEPEKTKHVAYSFGVRATFTRRVDNSLAVRGEGPARDTNSIGDVPDSGFYTNRIGRLPLTPEDVFWGACDRDGSSAPPPGDALIIGQKTEGMNPGFIATDSADNKYIVKFDPPGRPEMQTGADIVGTRLFWALGYFVAEDSLYTLHRDQLKVDPKAMVLDGREKRPMRASDIDDVLALVEKNPDGTYRCQMSRFIPGKVLGPLAQEGTRKGDLNDRIDHEDRRSLRALKVFAAWINHYDIHEGNILDTLVKEGGKSFVRHYMIDFGEAFAGAAGESGNYRSGYEYRVDPSSTLRSFFSLGLYVHRWEHVVDSGHRGIGPFGAAHFSFEDWKPALPNRYMKRATDPDLLWGVDKLLALENGHLEAAVRAGGYTDPAAREYLIETLKARREIIALEVLDRVNPATGFTLNDGGRVLKFSDLAIDHGLADRTGTTWLVQTAVRGPQGERRGATRETIAPLFEIPDQPLAKDDQLVIRIQTMRSGRRLGDPVHVHLDSWDDSGTLHIVGIDRWHTGKVDEPSGPSPTVAQFEPTRSQVKANATNQP